MTTKDSHKLTTKKLFNHFFLLHDFLYKFSKTQAEDAKHFDLQLQVSSEMINATRSGGRFGQLSTLIGFMAYCLRSKKIGRKFFYGFLYVYWINHFYTLGSYLGALIKMPKLYNKVGQYYISTNKSENPFSKLNEVMDTVFDYDDPHSLLSSIFTEKQIINPKSLVVNDFFEKNKDKYIPKEESYMMGKNLQLAYFDSFITRYIYHSFARWLKRVALFAGLQSQ